MNSRLPKLYNTLGCNSISSEVQREPAYSASSSILPTTFPSPSSKDADSPKRQLFHVEQVLSDMPTPNYMTMAKCTSCMPRTRAYRIATVRVSAKGYSIGFIRPIHKNTLCGTTRRLLSPIRGKYENPLKTRPIPIDEPQSNGP